MSSGVRLRLFSKTDVAAVAIFLLALITNHLQNSKTTAAFKFKLQASQLQSMMNPETEKVLQGLDLNLGLELTQQVVREVGCVEREGGSRLCELEIVAVAALVASSKRLLAVDCRTLVGTGIPLQAFLSKIPFQEKHSLLDSIERLSGKCHSQVPLLKQKLSRMRTVFFLYAQYGRVFTQLSAKSHSSRCLNQTLANIFWVAYLKNNASLSTTSDLTRKMYELCWYLQWVFDTFFASWARDQLLPALQHQAIYQERQASEQFKAFVTKVLQDFNSVCAYRQMASCKLSSKFQEETFAELFLDDYCRLSQQEQHLKSPHYISYTLFFKRNTMLAPRPRLRLPIPQHDGLGIIDRLNLQQNEQQWNQAQAETPTLSRFFLNELNRAQNSQYVLIQNNEEECPVKQLTQIWEPIAAQNNKMGPRQRLKALGWIQRAAQESQRSSRQILSPFFRQFLCEDLQQFIKFQQKLAQKLIGIFFPLCRDTQARANKTIGVYLSILAEVAQNQDDQQVKQLFSSARRLNGYLFVTTMLVLYAYKAQPVSLKGFMKELGINSQDVFVALNWIREKSDAPNLMKWWATQVEKELLLKLIWNEETMHKLLENIRNRRETALEKALLKRIQNHICFQINQICGADTELKLKVCSIVQKIEKNDINTLLCNSVNSVLLAAIAVAQKSSKAKAEISRQELQSTLLKWRSLCRSFPEKIDCFDNTGARVGFLAFLKTIQDVFQGSRETNKNENSSQSLVFGATSKDGEIMDKE